MRIDKLLWCLRYYKTRNIATEACKKGHIKLNGQNAKPSKEVMPQDQISIRKNPINYTIQITDLPESRVGAKLVGLYRTDLTPKEEYEMAELQRLSQEYYREKGEGRPTKKDRRNIDDFLDFLNNQDLL